VSPAAITLIVGAAIAHATWNLLSKQASATGAVFFIWLLAACAAVIYSPVTVLAVSLGQPHLTRLNWLFLAGTGVLQSGYFLFLQRGYSLGDLSVVYPIGRGAGAMLAALAGIVLLGERPSPVAITGTIAIGVGVVLIGIPGAARRTASQPAGTSADAPLPDAPAIIRPAAPARGAIVFALLTGMFIASYTIWDKYAVADLHTPPILQGYACFPVMTAVFAPFVLRDRQRLAEVWRSFRLQVLGAALLAPLAYILVLTALSFTAVSAVAPAREVSVLFGVLLGGRLLGESGLARRLTGATAIVAGIIAIAVT
jgi:drug/metabolite transporter (DMT)-like permease